MGSGGSMAMASAGNGRRAVGIPVLVNQFSQGLDLIETAQDDDICKKCQQRGGDRWVCCDACDCWYHMECLGLDKLPEEHEKYYCPDCMRPQASLGRQQSDFPRENLMEQD